MARIDVPTPSQAAAYAEQLARVRTAFEEIGYGSRQAASFAVRIPASRISGVLNHREHNPAILDRLDAWSRAELRNREAAGATGH